MKGLECIGPKGCGYQGLWKEFTESGRKLKCPQCGKTRDFICITIEEN